jgi:N-acyl-D-amino-acid deacylase
MTSRELMNMFDTIIPGARLIDGTGAEPFVADLCIADGKIAAIGDFTGFRANEEFQADSRVLAPGFIDVHTHDDLHVIRHPSMLPKLSQGVTTVIAGNCGISAAPLRLVDEPADPINLLGEGSDFTYPCFAWLRGCGQSGNPCRQCGGAYWSYLAAQQSYGQLSTAGNGC